MDRILVANVSFENAKLLKEKGFVNGTKGCYTKYIKTQKSDNPSFKMTKGELEEDSDWIVNNGSGDFSNGNYIQCERPVQQVAVDWLRINHNIIVEAKLWWGATKNPQFLPSVLIKNNGEWENLFAKKPKSYLDPNEAISVGLNYALKKLVKNV